MTTDKPPGTRKPDNAYYLLVGLAAAVTLITVGALLIYVGYFPQLAMSNFWKRHTEEHFGDDHDHGGSGSEEGPTIYIDKNGTVLNDHDQRDHVDHGQFGHAYHPAANERYSHSHHPPPLHSFTVLRILGPIFSILGCVLLVAIALIGARINWEAVPESSPGAKFAKLRAELALSILGAPGGSSSSGSSSSTSKYELMVPIEMEARTGERVRSQNMEPVDVDVDGAVAGPSTSNSMTEGVRVPVPIEPIGSSQEYLNDFSSNKIHMVEIL